MKKILFIFLLLSFSVFTLSYSSQGDIPLLAVSVGNDGNFTGSVANLLLDIKPGVGRIFIDTYPFTKLDTQFTTRYANEFACNYAKKKCENYDFFYTIKAGSAIVGGPSAGAATTLLTVAMLNEKEIPSNIAITGTIGSGGIIGPVGGVEEKIIAAQKKGITTIYVPKIGLNLSNVSFTARIVPVNNFDELYYDLFGEKRMDYINIMPSEMYIDTMKQISENLCSDAKNMRINVSNSSFNDLGDELYNKSFAEILSADYYSAASYCFGASSQFQTQKVLLLNDSEIKNQVLELSLKYFNVSNEINSKKIMSFTDLQAYMVTTQRLTETADSLFKINATNITLEDKRNLAYAIVRLNSAIYWSEFFSLENNENFAFDDSALFNSCLSKLNEVEGYLNYVKDYLDLPLSSTAQELEKAYDDYYSGNYALCLFKAIKSKADADLILSTMGIKQDDITNLVVEKEKIARNSIGDSIEKGIFPILAYSYYTYGQTLNESDIYSSLLYYEYASAMSDISIYFEKKNLGARKLLIPKEDYTMLLLGFLIGASLTTLSFIAVLRLNNSNLKKGKSKSNLKRKNIKK